MRCGIELERFDAPLHFCGDRDRVAAELVGDARMRRLAVDLDDDVDAAAVAERDLVARADRQHRACRQRFERLVEHGRALVRRASLGADADEEAAGGIESVAAQSCNGRADGGEAALALARTDADPELAPVRALHAPRAQWVCHLVAVMERRVAEQKQLVARALAEARDDVVQAVDLDGPAELLERRGGDIAGEAASRGSSGSTRFSPSGTSVSAATNRSNQPQSRSTSIVDAHAASDGMISSPYAASTCVGQRVRGEVADVEVRRAGLRRTRDALAAVLGGADEAERVGIPQRHLVGHPLLGCVGGRVPVLRVRDVGVDAADDRRRVDLDPDRAKRFAAAHLRHRDDVRLHDPCGLALVVGDMAERAEAELDLVERATGALGAGGNARAHPLDELGSDPGHGDHAVCDLSCELERFRAVRGHVHRHGTVERGMQMHLPSLEVDRLTRGQPADERDPVAHPCQARRLQTERLDRAVASTDAKDRASRRELLERDGRRRGDGGMTCLEIRDARPERDPLGRLGRERKTRPDVTPEKLRVRQPRDVEAGPFGVRNAACDVARVGARRNAKAEAHGQRNLSKPLGFPRPERCPSGLRSATGNRVRAERCVAGSNPALSAYRALRAASALTGETTFPPVTAGGGSLLRG